MLALLKPKSQASTFTDHYRALLFLAAMLVFLLFCFINTTTFSVTVYPPLVKCALNLHAMTKYVWFRFCSLLILAILYFAL